MHQLERPLAAGTLWLTDGGLETTMIFDEGLDLPCFAAFTLLDSPAGRDALTRYRGTCATLARDAGTGLMLDTPTWRGGTTWGAGHLIWFSLCGTGCHSRLGGHRGRGLRSGSAGGSVQGRSGPA